MENISRKYPKLHLTRQGIAEQERYSVLSYVTVFFALSFVGWIWEFFIKWATLGEVVNSGFFHGPWVPIYGAGSVLMLMLFQFFKRNPFETFLLNMGICGTIEYLTSVVLEKIYGTVWWDYSREFMNINGRICLFGLIIFGIGGCFIIYFAGPAINRFLHRHSVQGMRVVLRVISLLFIIDVMFSLLFPNVGNGISNYFH